MDSSGTKVNVRSTRCLVKVADNAALSMPIQGIGYFRPLESRVILDNDCFPMAVLSTVVHFGSIID